MMDAASILVVDDEVDILVTTQLLLELEGFSVQTASNGCDALESIGQHKPRLIITDHMMPRMNGIELCTRLRADPGTQQIPIIMCSATPKLQNHGLHVDGFLLKPVNFDELLALIRSVLSQSADCE